LGDFAELLATATGRFFYLSAGISPLVDQFEQKFAEWCGLRYGVATNSGTSALHLALVALGIGKGDEVIIPDLTMIACANVVSYLNDTINKNDFFLIAQKRQDSGLSPNNRTI